MRLHAHRSYTLRLQCTADQDATIALFYCSLPNLLSPQLHYRIFRAVSEFLVHKTEVDILTTTCNAGLPLRTALGLQQR